jgi:putative flippase GtrA
MVDAVARLWGLRHTPHGKKMIRYTMVSIVTTVAGFTLLGIIFGVLHLWTEVPSAIVASTLATAPSYYLNRSWVWGKAGRSHWRREILPFWAVSIAGILLSVVAAAVSRHLSTAHHLSHSQATGLLLVITLAAFAFLWLLKFLVFNRLFMRTQPATVLVHDDAL